jgi:predicted outer membrane lipoprotein
MAYTDPNTGITRDKYGNEVRDATGTGRSSTNYVPWIIGLVLAAAVAAFTFNASNMSNTSTIDRSAPETTTTQPATPPNTPAP